MADTVLIIGASGFLGGTLLQHLPPEWSVVGTGYSKASDFKAGYSRTSSRHDRDQCLHLDITDAKQVQDVMERINPQIVLLSAALADIDRCETSPELARRTNVLGVEQVARCCQNRLLVYYSTNAVFDGTDQQQGNYQEEDQPHPVNVYGETKLQAENIVKNLPQHLILRTVMLYTNQQNGPKFINWLIRSLSQGTTVKAATDFIMNPTFIPDLAAATVALVHKKCLGLYHVAGGSSLSCHEMALQIVQRWGFNPALVQPATCAELLQSIWQAPRPKNAALNINKLKQEGISMLTFEQGIQKVWEASRRWK